MPFAIALLFAVLFALGDVIDRSQPLSQLLLFSGLQLASLGGATLGATWMCRDRSAPVRIAVALAALVGWRLSYFPVMVFSGHIASIGEWVQGGVGLDPWIYPVFLMSVAALHTAIGLLAGLAVVSTQLLPRAVLAAGFAFASLISFSDPSDLTLLPDTSWRLEAEVPELAPGVENPYLPEVSAPTRAWNQKLMLIAAGLTYETIPDSRWARGVRAALEHSFRANPIGSTRDRTLEHHVAYHSAHPLIGGTAARP